MEFLHARLDNGLEIVSESNSQAYSTALGFFVDTGARDESEELAGVSHFLEHMAFKGTPRRTADDVNREFDEMGAHYNAYTTEENTVYYAAVLPEQQARVLELLADILRPSLRDEDFETERQVILEEIHMYEDQPPFGADERCRAEFYRGHPLGQSVLGTLQSVQNLRVEAMRDYFRRRYSPTQIVLVGAGCVDFDALVESARRHCGAWEPFDGRRGAAPPAPCQGFRSIEKPSATQQYAVQLAAGPSATDADRYAAKLLATVLGDDTGSRLYWELVDTGLAEHASLGHCEYEEAGAFMTYLTCDPDQMAENLQRVLDLYRHAECHGIGESELRQSKNKLGARIVLSAERPRGRLFAVGSDWIQRRQYRTVRDDLLAIDDVTPDDLAAALAKYRLSQSMTVTVGPLPQVQPPR